MVKDIVKDTIKPKDRQKKIKELSKALHSLNHFKSKIITREKIVNNWINKEEYVNKLYSEGYITDIAFEYLQGYFSNKKGLAEEKLNNALEEYAFQEEVINLLNEQIQ